MEAVKLNGLVDISNEDYHAGPGISKSHLDVIRKSPRHYWAKYIDPNRQPEPPTPAMIIGSATHAAILEPDVFTDRYIVVPDGAPARPTSRQVNAKNPSPQTRLDIDWWEDFDKENTGRTLLTADDYAACIAMRNAVHAHPVAAPLFTDGKAEQAFYSTVPVHTIDNETGEIITTDTLIKCKPDWLTSNGMIVDVKTTDDASPAGFSRSVANFRYYVQAPFYLDILDRLYGEAPEFFIFVVVEKKPPYAIGVYYVEKDDLEFGRRHYVKDLQRIVECKNAADWPDYATQIEALRLPRWLTSAAD